MRCGTILATGLLAALALDGVPADAAEPLGAHANAPQRTLVLDRDRIIPSTLTMDHGDVLVVENYATDVMRVTFTDPPDQAEKIRCSFLSAHPGTPAKAPWLLWSWDAEKHLTAVVPSGRFASLCSLGPGEYTVLAVRAVDRQLRPPLSDKGEKAVISVK